MTLRSQHRSSAKNGSHPQRVRVMDILKQIVPIDGEDFVWQLYTQLLNRRADVPGLRHFTAALRRDVSKAEIIADILGSPEALSLYEKSDLGTPLETFSVANLIRTILPLSETDFLAALYQELLNREPDAQGLTHYSNQMKQGMSRMEVAKSILQSPECLCLMNLQTTAEYRAPSSSQISIGVYITFPGGVSLDGEGIGRFTVRLVEGMLARCHDVVIHIVTSKENYNMFLQSLLRFVGRLNVHISDEPKWINDNVPVDAWIVPYIGLERALNLTKPIILIVHDLVYLHFPELYYRTYGDFCRRLDRIVYRMAKKASALIFPSEYIRNHEGFRFLHVSMDKTHVIRLAAPKEEYQAFGTLDENLFRAKYGLKESYIVYPSVIRLHKNHAALIEAFLNFRQSEVGKPSELILVITDQYQDRPNTKDILSVLDRFPETIAWSAVRFLGRISASDVPSLYQFSVGCIVPTLFEGSCPFQILEALSVGAPVTFGRLPVTQEVIKELDQFVTFDPTSIEEIQAAIETLWLARDHHQNRQLPQISILERTWEDVAYEYCEVVRGVLNRP